MKVRLKHERLAKLLAGSRMSQNRWAIRIGISRSFLSMLANGQRPYPSAQTRRKLLRAFKVPFHELFQVEVPHRRARGATTRFGRAFPLGSGRSLSKPGAAMQNLWQDIRYALRTLARKPFFAAVAIATLALGIGANTAIFSVVNGLLIKPLPYRDAEDLVYLCESLPSRGIREISISYPNFVDWREQSHKLEGMAAYDSEGFALQDAEGRPHLISGLVVSEGFFDVLGVRPRRGRAFNPEEEAPGGQPAAVISHRLWQEYFGSDPGLPGKSVKLDGRLVPVVGVMGPHFRFPERHDIWMPLGKAETEYDRSARFLDVVGRLAQGSSFSEARAEMMGIVNRLREAYPEHNSETGLFMVPFREENVGQDDRLLIGVLSGVVFFVLLIACANVANLALARSGARRREVAVRSAMGAGRSRLVRQLLTESVLIALLAGGLGFALGWWLKNLVAGAMPADQLPFWMSFDFDSTVVAFSLAAAILTGLIFGSVPALQLSRPDSGDVLREASQGAAGSRRGRWLSRGLVVAEVTLAMVLLVGSGLLMQGYLHQREMDLGFDRQGLLLVDLNLPEGDYPDSQSRVDFFQQTLDRLRALPGVEKASAMQWKPLVNFRGAYLLPEGYEAREGGGQPIAVYQRVMEGYFETIGTDLLRGRPLRASDREGSQRVAVVNQRLAESYFPGEDAVGRRIALGRPTEDPEWITIVGVAEDAKLDGYRGESMPAVYVPYRQHAASRMVFLLRTPLDDPASLAPAARQAVWSVDPALPIFAVQTMEEIVALDDWEQDLFSWIFSGFSLLALLLATVGLYGVVAYSVSQRRAEIGVRMALGARASDVLRLIMRSGLTLALIGLALGALGALALTQVLSSLLIGVSPTDPATFLATALLLLATALLAAYLPARRATRIDPLTTLRAE